MTKTIEEKANEKYNNPVEPYCFETDNEEQWYGCGLRDGYIEGATEQRKIDIEKACDWIEENLFTVNENGEYKYVAKNIYGSPYIKKDLFRDFCEAMEEKL